VPDFKGIESFKGRWYHTGQWPKERVDFTGKRVGVIGTGSSAIQLIPVVAEQAQHLTIFQRTANFSLPSGNEPMDPQYVREFKRHYPEHRAEADRTPFGIAGHPPPTKRSSEATPEERERAYTARWGTGGNIAFLYAFKDLLVDKEANEIASDFVRRKIRETVKDQTVAEQLLPNDHYIGTKRLCLDLGYYETFNRDNVSLVNIRKAPIQEITERGIRTADTEYELDAIIFATGYDAMTGALLDIDIRVEDGPSLREKWAAGPTTYLGLLTAGFPNLLIITGPGSPSVKSNMIAAIEQHVNWIHDLLAHVKASGYARVEADPQSETKWVSHVNDVANSTLYPLANSWYVGANIPGKPRVFMPYVAGLDKYRDICDDVAAKGYTGLMMER
jgi:cyclohexanone monooxygenase